MKIRYLILFGLIALFSSCTEEVNFSPETDAIEISAQISSDRIPSSGGQVLPVTRSSEHFSADGLATSMQTRAAIDEDGKGRFVAGDAMTLWAKTSSGTTSFEMSFDGKHWSPDLTWSLLQADEADFSGIYPPLEKVNAVPVFTHTVAADQLSLDAYDSSDLLLASASGVRGVPVQLDFTHAMSRIRLDLRSDGSYTEEQLATAVVRMNAYHQVQVHAEDASLGALQGVPVQYTFHPMGGGRFQAVVCPQEVLPDWRTECWLDIEIAGRHVSFKAPASLADGQAFDRLEAGKQVTLHLTVNRKGEPEIDWRNKSFWVYGLKGIPALDQWGLYSNDPYQGKPYPILGLTWKPEYGWYDCNKIDPAGPSAGDNNMCWAATCSNLLHWWMDQNAGNIERYGHYTGPRLYPDSYSSEIFMYYKQHFTNDGYFIPMGLKWFFTGYYQEPGANSADLKKPHDGFFKDVFDMPEVGAASSYGMTETLKQVLQEKKSIGLEIHLKAGRGAHAITLWGAEFDQNGEVCTLYIAENNDRFYQDQSNAPMRPGKICSAGLYAHKVKKMSDGSYWMESSIPGKYTISIQTLVFLGTNEADWTRYFQSHSW